MSNTLPFAWFCIYAASIFVQHLFLRSFVQLSLVFGLTRLPPHLQYRRSSTKDKWLPPTLIIGTYSYLFRESIRYFQDFSCFMPCGNFLHFPRGVVSDKQTCCVRQGCPLFSSEHWRFTNFAVFRRTCYSLSHFYYYKTFKVELTVYVNELTIIHFLTVA